jgi:hypothetical protein
MRLSVLSNQLVSRIKNVRLRRRTFLMRKFLLIGQDPITHFTGLIMDVSKYF